QRGAIGEQAQLRVRQPLVDLGADAEDALVQERLVHLERRNVERNVLRYLGQIVDDLVDQGIRHAVALPLHGWIGAEGTGGIAYRERLDVDLLRVVEIGAAPQAREIELRGKIADDDAALRMGGKFLQHAKPQIGVGIAEHGRAQELVGPALELHQLADAPKTPSLAVLRLQPRHL